MKMTSAVLTICHALWPGPGPEIFEATSGVRATLLKYASMSATRCSRVGSAGAAGAAAGSVWAQALTAVKHARKSQAARRVGLSKDRIMTDEHLAALMP